MSEGQSLVAIQMQLRGIQDTRVMAPAAYIGEPELHMRIGPAFFILKDEDAYKSIVDALRKLERVGKDVFCDMDAFDDVQAEADRRMARYGTERRRRRPAQNPELGL